MSSWQVEVSRSMADWASSGSVMSGSPFAGVAVGGDHGGGFAVAFGDYLIKVGGLGGGEGLEREVVDDEQLDGGQAAVFVVQGVVQAGGGEAFEELVGAGHVDGAAAADGDVAQGGGQVGLA